MAEAVVGATVRVVLGGTLTGNVTPVFLVAAGGGVGALLEHTLLTVLLALLARMALRSKVALWKARSRSVKRWLGVGVCGI